MAVPVEFRLYKPPDEISDNDEDSDVDNDENSDVLRLTLGLLMGYLGDIAFPDNFIGIQGWNSVQRWIWSEVYSSLGSGDYEDWTPFNGMSFPENTSLYLYEQNVNRIVLAELLGDEILDLLLREIIPRWGAFLVREVHTEDDFDRIETLKDDFVTELMEYIAILL